MTALIVLALAAAAWAAARFTWRSLRLPDALRESERQLHQALDAAQAGTWVWDVATNRNHWSPEVFGLYDLDPRLVEPSYEAWLGAVHPDDRAAAVGAVQTAVRDRSELYLEWRVNDVAGPERWLLSRGRAECDSAGQLVRYFGIVADITKRKRSELALRDSEELYRTVFRTSPDAITINRRSDGAYLDVNDGFCRAFGWTPEEVIGRTSRDIGIWQHAQDRVPFIEAIDREGHCDGYETTFLTKTGASVMATVSSRAMTVRGVACMLTVTRDISAMKKSETSLRKLYQALEQSPESIIITNLAGEIEYVNQAFCRTSGYATTEALGKTPEFLKSGNTDPAVIASMWNSLKAGTPWQGEFHNRRKDGSEYTEYATVAPIRQADGQVTHFVAVQQDITERVQAEKKIQQLAYYDQLTGLPNRTLLFDRLRQATSNCARFGVHGVLMMLDLDHFKILNDTLGHDIGDQLLRQVAARVGTCVRHGDTLARLGGDEFMLVMTGLAAEPQEAAADAQVVARKILASFKDEFLLGDALHNCSASIGITLFSNDLVSGDELMKQADLAMYKAKEDGRDGLRFFDPEMEATVKLRSALERDLRRGLETHQFELHYQPQVTTAGRIFGAEALVRWRHPSRGLVPPSDFIPIAEDSGLILPLGSEIFAMAFSRLAHWADIPGLSHLALSVNVSARQIRQADFVARTLATLRAAGGDPARLKLEITESLLIENAEDIVRKMVSLKKEGVGFSLDDFGTGFSSLSYLKRLPLDQLKIDQSFVRGVLTEPNDAVIARAIIALAGSMGLEVIAEGVETESERAFLAAAGCGNFQGYLFGRPMPPEAFEQQVLLAASIHA